MNISLNKILDKMQLEVQVAKGEESEQKVRERLMAIRTLCDLVLDETPAEMKRVDLAPVQPIPQVVQQMPNMQQPTTIHNTTKLKEDDANGDSLFDF